MLSPLVLAGLLTATQTATPGPVVRWDAPPGCPDGTAVLAELTRRLGRAPEPGELELAGRIVRDGGRGFALQLDFTVGDRRETRELRDSSCVALAEAAALRVAAAVAPLAATDAPLVPVPAAPVAEAAVPAPTAAPEAPAPVDVPAAAPSVAPAPAPTPAPTATPAPAPKNMSRGPGGVLRLQGGGEFGALPGATGALGLAGGLLWPRLRLELQAGYLAPRTQEAAAGQVRVDLFAAGLHACGRIVRGSVEVPLCVGVEAGAMRGEGRQLPGSRRAVAGWFGAVLGPAFVWTFAPGPGASPAAPRWGLWAAAQVVLAPVHPRFEAGDPERAETLFVPGVASGRLLLGVELRLRDPR